MISIKNSKFIPESATIALTYKCNARCKMCNIWKEKAKEDLPLDAFHNLDKDLKYVNLTGGEPFLRKDIVEIVKATHEISPKAQIIISTNGFLTKWIVKAAEEIKKTYPRIGIRISLDGLEEKHDEIRGIPGIYKRAIKTMERLKELGIKNLGFSFTIIDDNIDDLAGVYALAKKSNVEFAVALAQNSAMYFKKEDNIITLKEEISKNLEYIIISELKSWNLKKWLRAYYAYGLKHYLMKKERLLGSGAGFDSLFIAPDGKIYPSNLLEMEIGNINEEKLRNAWNSHKACNVRKLILEKNITEDWNICGLRQKMRAHWARVIYWIIKNKLCLVNKKS